MSAVEPEDTTCPDDDDDDDHDDDDDTDDDDNDDDNDEHNTPNSEEGINVTSFLSASMHDSTTVQERYFL